MLPHVVYSQRYIGMLFLLVNCFLIFQMNSFSEMCKELFVDSIYCFQNIKLGSKYILVA